MSVQRWHIQTDRKSKSIKQEEPLITADVIHTRDLTFTIFMYSDCGEGNRTPFKKAGIQRQRSLLSTAASVSVWFCIYTVFYGWFRDMEDNWRWSLAMG